MNTAKVKIISFIILLIAVIILFISSGKGINGSIKKVSGPVRIDYQISQKDFEGEKGKRGLVELAQINKYSELVSRKTENGVSTLTLKLDSGTEIKIPNFAYDNHDHIETYYFDEYYPEIDSYGVFGYYWESGNYILISKKTGEKLDIYGKPVFSSNKAKFVSYSGSLSGEIPNAFVVFKVNKDKTFKKLGEVGDTVDQTSKLLPVEVSWLSDSNIRVISEEPVQDEKNTYVEYIFDIKK